MGPRSGESFVVAAATRDDLAFAAALHATSLPDSFFASLGVTFLQRYYRMFLASPHGVVLVARCDDERVGSLVGTTDDVAHVRWATRSYWWRLGVAAGRAMLAHPSVLVHFARTRLVRYLRGLVRLWRATAATADTTQSLGVSGTTGTLSHIAVSEVARGGGVGRALLAAFQAGARAAGTDEIHTSTRLDETGAAGFYQQAGWRPAGTTVDVDGRAMARFEVQLGE